MARSLFYPVLIFGWLCSFYSMAQQLSHPAIAAAGLNSLYGTTRLFPQGASETGGLLAAAGADTLPFLPIAIGAATAEVHNGNIYLFGGGSNWWGQTLYPYIYKFDGAEWSVYDSIPDNSVWDMESVLVGDDVYLLTGWRSGSRKIRRYNLLTKNWTVLTESLNSVHWGTSAEYLNGTIYHIAPSSNLYRYSIATDSWDQGAPPPELLYGGVASVIFQDEIYVVGFYNRGFYKYNPASDQWTSLAATDYQVAGCAMEVIGDSIYCVGGSGQGSPQGMYDTIQIYSVSGNSWTVSPRKLCEPRLQMASVLYQDRLSVIGGLGPTSAAVNLVESTPWKCLNLVGIEAADLLPEQSVLAQNYPNPFNPATTIRYSLPVAARVDLTIYSALGQPLKRLVESQPRSAGWHEVVWNGRDEQGDAVGSGVYFYRLSAGSGRAVGRMLLVR